MSPQNSRGSAFLPSSRLRFFGRRRVSGCRRRSRLGRGFFDELVKNTQVTAEGPFGVGPQVLDGGLGFVAGADGFLADVVDRQRAVQQTPDGLVEIGLDLG